MVDLSEFGDRVPSKLPVDGTLPSPSWAAVGTEWLQTPFQRVAGGGRRRLQSATSATISESWCHQAVETTNLSRRLQPPSRDYGHARSSFRHPTRGNPRITFPQACSLGLCVGTGAAVGSRLIDGMDVRSKFGMNAISTDISTELATEQPTDNS